MPKIENVKYRDMLADTDKPYCWVCGGDQRDQPSWWHAPFLVERCHIVNKPRAADRRAVVLMCSRCHRTQHGERLPESTPPISRANLLWCKWRYDRDWYDEAFLAAHHVGVLPAREIPHRSYRANFLARRPETRQAG